MIVALLHYHRKRIAESNFKSRFSNRSKCHKFIYRQILRIDSKNHKILHLHALIHISNEYESRNKIVNNKCYLLIINHQLPEAHLFVFHEAKEKFIMC